MAAGGEVAFAAANSSRLAPLLFTRLEDDGPARPLWALCARIE